MRYDNICVNSISAGSPCTFTLNIPEDLDSPYMYYKMDNFYANHRKYAKSRNYKQLRGESVSRGDVKEDCDPILDNEDIPVTTSYTGQALASASLAYPCGLIGKFRFTDTFSITDASSNAVAINSGDIAHGNDIDHKFINQGSPGTKQWLNFEDQHLMVWYQMETFPKFIKLYGKINGKLAKGSYTVTVNNQWDVSFFKGEKSLYFSTVNGLGGTNVFLGV